MRIVTTPSRTAHPVLVALGLALALGALFAVGTLTGLGAQEMEALPQPSQLATQSLRPYWHVFAAYTLAIVLIGGWALSIARRLKEVERRLEGGGE